jgi:Fe-S protein assembly co-chaperone HscB
MQPRRYTLNLSSLKEKYREYQMILHPDKLVAKGHDPQDYSKVLSAAYTTLLNDVTRAQHIVKPRQFLHSQVSPELPSPSQPFLAFVFEMDCQITEADQAELASLHQKLSMQTAEAVQRVTQCISAGQWEEARLAVAELAFLNRLTKTATYTHND